MQNLKNVFRTLRDEESGQGLVEYGLIIALVSLAAVTALGTMGGKIVSTFDGASAKLK